MQADRQGRFSGIYQQTTKVLRLLGFQNTPGPGPALCHPLLKQTSHHIVLCRIMAHHIASHHITSTQKFKTPMRSGVVHHMLGGTGLLTASPTCLSTPPPPHVPPTCTPTCTPHAPPTCTPHVPPTCTPHVPPHAPHMHPTEAPPTCTPHMPPT